MATVAAVPAIAAPEEVDSRVQLDHRWADRGPWSPAAILFLTRVEAALVYGQERSMLIGLDGRSPIDDVCAFLGQLGPELGRGVAGRTRSQVHQVQIWQRPRSPGHFCLFPILERHVHVGSLRPTTDQCDAAMATV